MTKMKIKTRRNKVISLLLSMIMLSGICTTFPIYKINAETLDFNYGGIIDSPIQDMLDDAFYGDATWADNSPVYNEDELPPSVIFIEPEHEYEYTPLAERIEMLMQIDEEQLEEWGISLDFDIEINVPWYEELPGDFDSQETQLDAYLDFLHDDLQGSEVDLMLQELLSEGYPLKPVLSAYGMSKVLEIDIYEFLPELEELIIDEPEDEEEIPEQVNQREKNQGRNNKNNSKHGFKKGRRPLPENLSETGKHNYELLAEDYHVRADVLAEYAEENDLGFYEIEQLSEYSTEYVMQLSTMQTVAPMSASADIVPTEQIGAPFSYDYNQSEKINLNTGGLVYETIDYVLPGVNGLDVVIGRRYNSDMANEFNPYADSWYGYQTGGPQTSMQKNDYFNNLYGLGYGWSFMFSSIQSESVLHLADGRSFAIEREPSPSLGFKIKDYTLNDLRLVKNNGGYSGATYYLLYKDGRREFFNSDGNLIAIRDKYDNTIKFYNSSGGSGSSFIIVDTLNRTITIPKSGTNRTVTLNDKQTVSTILQYTVGTGNETVLTSYKDAMGIETRYHYTRVSGAVCAITPTMLFAKTNYFMNLTSITHPTGASTHFTYELIDKNLSNKKLGTSGLQKVYRITSREDRIGTAVYNRKIYTYSPNNNSGWGTDPATRVGSSIDLPTSFTYSTTVTTAATNLSETHTFNNEHLTTEIVVNHGTKKISNKKIEYNDDKLPEKVTTANFDYTSNSRSMTTIELSEYDKKGNVTASWSPLSNGVKNTEHKTTYTYDSAYNQLTRVSYKQNSGTDITIDYTLDSTKKYPVTEIINVGSSQKERTDWTYDNYGNIISERRNGTNANSGGILTSYDYKDNAYLASVSTSGVLTAAGTSIAGANGFSAGTVGTRYEYDITGRLTKVTDPRGNATSYEYNARNDLIRVTNPDNTQRQWARSYTQNYTTFTDERGSQMTTIYNQLGFPLETRDNTTTGTVLNRKTYDNISRLLTDTDVINNNVTTYTYDHLSRVTDITTKSGTATLARESYVYSIDAAGLYKTQKTLHGDTNAPSVVTASYVDKNGFETQTGFVIDGVERLDTYKHDYLGNMTETLTALDKQNNRAFTAKYEYDYAGRITKETNTFYQSITYTYDTHGRNTGITDPLGRMTTFAYDNLGRLLTKTAPFDASRNAVTRYTYDQAGNITKEETQNNAQGATASWSRTDYVYNNRNFLTQTNIYNGSSVAERAAYLYDAAGNVTRLTTGVSSLATTNYTYDKYNNVTSITDALGQAETYTYDLAGNVTRKTNRNGIQTNYTYDGLGRLLTTNAGGNLTTQSYTLTGQIRTVSNSNFSQTNTYDELGRLTKQTETGNVTKEYTYDIGGNRLSFVSKIGSTTHNDSTYTYDGLNRLYIVKENGVLAATYYYDCNGNRSYLVLWNSVATEYTYNYANLVTKVENKKGNVLSSYTYTYKLDGNQHTKTDHTGKVTTYTYDGLGRLTNEVETGSNISYTYDTRGNRLTMTNNGVKTDYTYDLNNRLTRTVSGGVTTNYTYDKNGNQLSDGAVTNVYDTYNRLTRTTSGSTVTNYAYRPDGLRHSKTTGTGTTTHLWDGSNIVLDNVSGVITKYVRGIDLFFSVSGSIINHCYLHNAHGDVVQLTNSSGTVTKNYNYDTFGNEFSIVATDNNPFRYCGEYFDKETGTYYLRARYYQPRTGRFLSQDPINDGLNWYTYAANNPVYYKDPTGLFATSDALDMLKAIANGTTTQTTKDALNVLKLSVTVTPKQNLYVEKVDNTVYIKGSFNITGEAANSRIGGYNSPTDMYSSLFFNGVEKFWNGDFGDYRVVTIAKKSSSGIKVNIKPDDGTSNVKYGKEGWSMSNPGSVNMDILSWDGSGNLRDADDFMWTAAHEFGHLLGLTAKDNKGNYGSDIMGVRDKPVTESIIEDVLWVQKNNKILWKRT